MDTGSKTIDIKLPTRWEDLTQKQLRYLFTLIAQGYSIDEVKAFCLFRWNKITILHRYGEKGYMCKKGKQRGSRCARLAQNAAVISHTSATDRQTPCHTSRLPGSAV